ncbi:hypothetical protein Pcinc_031054 [Petrolisthes cinctipes]|uniref:Uncharacterized protein n=1 Tax=Petrolisthes cinctipes TaxID=88211 RepID=A0AAE1EXF5_PETCI|nr:hypothetical protein Pcinc_031054 [Petrolisthes cinctipes]
MMEEKDDGGERWRRKMMEEKDDGGERWRRKMMEEKDDGGERWGVGKVCHSPPPLPAIYHFHDLLTNFLDPLNSRTPTNQATTVVEVGKFPQAAAAAPSRLMEQQPPPPP